MDKPERVASHLARNLSSLRHARGLTQATLAKAAGLPRSTIANLESGGGNPSLAVLVKVAAQLRVPIDELLASPRAKVRKWSAAELPSSAHGRGVTQRPLVPEPVPEEMLVRMEFAPGRRHDLRRGRSLRPRRGRRARISRQRAALLSQPRDGGGDGNLGRDPRQGRRIAVKVPRRTRTVPDRPP